MSSVMNFNASIFMTEQLNNLMVKAGQDLAQRAVTACAEHYKFDAEEAIRFLSLENVKVERKESGKSKKNDVLVKKVAVVKAAFPMPFNGEFKDACCYALRQNNGLYTQCQVVRKGENSFCKQCQVLADNGVDGIPEYGTIQQRMASGIFEYVDPKGRKPVSYTKVMKKYKLTQEQVEEEATKLNIVVDEGHFVAQSGEADAKRGRPSSQKEKAPKEEKQAKGRPKKAKKVIQIEGEDDDLFASLVADANNAEEEVKKSPEVLKKKGKTDEEKEAERLAKEAEKAEKEAKRLAEKAEKEAKLAAEKAQAQQEKEAKLATLKAEKEAKLATLKAEKEAKLAAMKAEKELKKPSKSTKKAVTEDEEPDVVKKIDFEGKKYLKSKKTNIVYDYIEYTKNQEQVVVGHWNETTNKIDFSNTDEESEDEYDE